ncbi:hypothetical protein PIB30_112588, partial [Stylosanthes scabra]|nr:hypothetical protein [Stylosanthes scabra]
SLIVTPTLATTTHRGSYAPVSRRHPRVRRPCEVVVPVLKLEAISSPSLRPSPSAVLTGCSEILKLEAFLFAPSQQSSGVLRRVVVPGCLPSFSPLFLVSDF